MERGSIVVVFCGGVNLLVIQWVLVRELTALLLGTELVVLLVSVSYFAGLSLGYALAGRVRRAWLAPLLALTLALHLALPVWFRLLVVGLEGVRAYPLAYVLLPLLTPLVVSAPYSIFLPLLVDSGAGKLGTLYGLELLGAAAGVLTLVAFGGWGLPGVYGVYTLAGLLILWALLPRHGRLWVGAAGAGCALWLLVLPGANYWSNALWYVALRGLPEGTITLFSGYSPYQKVDVLQDPEGGRYLYLDGLQHYDPGSGSRLNVIMGSVPGLLVRPENALVIGAGSMEMERFMAYYAGQVATVEIDPLVVEASVRYLDDINWMSRLSNRSIVVDDAKHFIANTPQMYDLVATDTPAAFTIQTATLYSEPFFAQVAAHLNPGGVLVVNLTSDFGPDDVVSRRIAAGLLRHFEEVLVVTSGSAGWSFAYAGDALPFDRAGLETALRNNDETEYALFETAAVRAVVGDAAPITLDSMDIVLHISAAYMRGRLGWGE
ncbi:MAG: hypothetical protein HXY40_14180 [Chloroflexi bacterium]|nr:hypothetical protein [Chloroflexota bacterium]